jgi:hypothetical protein
VQGRIATSNLAPVIALGEGAEKRNGRAAARGWTRGLETNVVLEPNDEERSAREYWRFWRMPPPRGKTGIFFGSWYTQPIRPGPREDGRGRVERRMVARPSDAAAEGYPSHYLHLSKKIEKKQFTVAPTRDALAVHENARKFQAV